MSQQGKIKRYILILEKVQKGYHPTLKEIIQYLFNQGHEVSSRTIQRDIEQIRYEFKVELKYNTSYRGYEIDIKNSLNIESLLHFLELYNTAEIISDSLQHSKETLNYIMFEAEGQQKGSQHLASILRAIKERLWLTFTHYNFHKDSYSTHRVAPYLLKQYQNRWYVVGKPDYTDEFRSFGVDRISDLQLTTDQFKKDTKVDPRSIFDHLVGLNYSEAQLERIVLEFESFQAKYANSLPLHESQKVLEENESSTLFELHVKPNFEFIQKILMNADRVKVLEPQWLADEVQGYAKRILNQYQT